MALTKEERDLVQQKLRAAILLFQSAVIALNEIADELPEAVKA